jgi:hypothetical protein
MNPTPGHMADVTDTRRTRRSLANIAFFSALTLGLLTTLQHSDPRQPGVWLKMTTSLQHAVTGDDAPVVSDYQRESTLTTRQLIERWNPLIAAASKQVGISQDWIRAVIHMESGGRTMLTENQPITSPVGAMGLMQLMPQTYDQMRAQLGLGTDAYDPQDNITAGAAYLRALYRRYGYPGMFAAYNDGPGNYEAYLRNARALPAQTRNYLDGVTRFLGARRTHDISNEVAKLTRPDGMPIVIAKVLVRSVRAPLPGEYAPAVRSVVAIGQRHQGVRETVAQARAALGAG